MHQAKKQLCEVIKWACAIGRLEEQVLVSADAQGTGSPVEVCAYHYVSNGMLVVQCLHTARPLENGMQGS